MTVTTIESLMIHSTDAADLTPIHPHASGLHVVLQACEAPGFYNQSSPSGEWNCDKKRHPASPTFPATCAPDSKKTLLYYVMSDGPVVQPPPGSGFKVGGETGYAFLVLNIKKEGGSNFSPYDPLESSVMAGFRLKVSSGVSEAGPLTQVGMAIVMTRGLVPRREQSHLEVAYKFRIPGLVMRPFALQVNTHSREGDVAVWKVTPEGEWTRIKGCSPQAFEFFVPTTQSDLLIKEGDLLALTCNINNSRTLAAAPE